MTGRGEQARLCPLLCTLVNRNSVRPDSSTLALLAIS
jgi:hypothetical protein